MPGGQHKLIGNEGESHTHQPSQSNPLGHTLSRKCVCAICVCGEHHCPSTPQEKKAWDPDALKSLYQAEFPGHTAPRERSFKPDNANKSMMFSDAPFEGDSLTRADYKAWPLAKREPAKAKQGNLGLEQRPFEGMTDYQREFIKHPYARQTFTKPTSEAFKSDAKFDANSVSRSDFVAHEGHKKEPSFKPALATRELVEENRDFTTDNRSQFVKHPYAKATSFKPADDQIRVRDAPFEGHSVTRQDYQRYEGARPEKSFKPSHTNRELAPEDRDWKTANSDFDAKTEFPTRAKAPEQQTHTEAHPFEGTSVARTDYAHHKGAKPAQAIKPRAVVLSAPVEDRDFKSAANAAYQPLPYSKREPYAPKSRALDQSAPFEATSSSRSDFQAHEGVHKPQSFKPKASEFQTSGKFEARSLKQDEFPAYPGYHAAKSTKPRGPTTTTSQGDDRSFQSESRSSFTAKTAEKCPSVNLKERKTKDGPGHKFYVEEEAGRWTPEVNYLRRSGTLQMQGSQTVSLTQQLQAASVQSDPGSGPR